jgi:uncharacterized ion transporter superfamily protein YfcC
MLELLFIRLNLGYALFTCVLIGILGSLVFFVWSWLNNSFSLSIATSAALNAGIVFAILGFILGLIIGNLK